LGQVGGLAAVGEADPNAQVVVGELAAGSTASPNMLKAPKVLRSPGMTSRKRRWLTRGG
jgi:hypothetical protein